MRRALEITVLATLTPLLSSCWAIGLVVGGTTAREDTIVPSRDPEAAASAGDFPEIGEWVEIELHSGRVVAGSYRGVQYGAFAVEAEQGLKPAVLEEVRKIRVVRGSYALEGTAIGLGADLLVVAVLTRAGNGRPITEYK